MVYRSANDYPSFLEECAQCSLTSGVCSDFCEDYYLVELSLADQVEDLAQAFRLVVGVDRQGVVFV